MNQKSMLSANKRMLIWFLIGVLIALLPWLALAQNNPVEKVKFNRNKEAEDAIGYAQAIKVGNTLYISGQVGTNQDMAESIRTAYDKLEKILTHYGLGFQHVVKENLFTTNIDAVKENAIVRRAYYKNDFPAATWVQIDRLYSPNANLEVELIAVLE
jgi:2-iminobutanoate/2-iminopropanoate deaminase